MKSTQLKQFLRFTTASIFGMALICSPSFAADNEQVTVFAAASLTNALNEIGQQYEKEHKTKVIFSFASSSTLAKQVTNGAPADLFISANQKWMDYLIEAKAVDVSSRKTLLKNTLVLIAEKDSPITEVTLNSDWDIKAALQGNRMAVGDPDHVPAGQYAKQALESLNLWKTAEPLLARANNVRAALALVEQGEAPFGIVYATDAKVTQKVKIVATFPATSYSPIEYPIALVKQESTASAKAFNEYLQGTSAKNVFEKYGFGVN
ncbi:molybdate ABC transporter substrate-binding protein [Shewanella glacialipiscicola]|uniref:Molybdate ABC transporter substrate-binding protein n=1 Tax=Shewanella glacialipiscicola TaxID=614069 RepID=A0ABQ6J980_9GAMM|nr:molybdate ABC transporter substrate-binding protein [Shewanella glacialipiscicola]MCL1085778.1 molybdate ABC transporter substrate-binding protein [Shewanella glacialipiscicola]GIU08633.1 molybdate ABC transporter substrate-binding protein [Shewanella glacialipiscicola]GMA83331.1 molybdate ABC transporter substrate-binding protein [Shewanella glacialipiscicola]